MTEDIVARVMRQWQQVHPGLDTGPMAVIGRLNRCSALFQQAADAPLRRAGLTRPEFDVLATLRRMGRELTPGRVARETFASGAAVTKRVRQLEQRGLLRRRPDDRDRRVTHLSLTDEGREIIDRLLPEQLRYEAALLEGIGERRQEELSTALGELLVVLEGRLAGLMD
ncbi:MarR family winged helix-turn-helix transcriptional regulator [Streptomyces sp. NPDC090442]|uniref:MarR family winged helix-turn-helix transcriptional regulator n=1 Tax=Streptomyces sp. NPDC090442 TaxID=3365962 RepID=UPI003824247D